eukprot:tig00020675_g12591.t1
MKAQAGRLVPRAHMNSRVIADMPEKRGFVIRRALQRTPGRIGSVSHSALLFVDGDGQYRVVEYMDGCARSIVKAAETRRHGDSIATPTDDLTLNLSPTAARRALAPAADPPEGTVVRAARWKVVGAMTVESKGEGYEVVTFSKDTGGFFWQKQLRGFPVPASRDSSVAEADMRAAMAPNPYSIPDRWVCHTAQEHVRVKWGLLAYQSPGCQWAERPEKRAARLEAKRASRQLVEDVYTGLDSPYNLPFDGG